MAHLNDIATPALEELIFIMLWIQRSERAHAFSAKGLPQGKSTIPPTITYLNAKSMRGGPFITERHPKPTTMRLISLVGLRWC